MLTLPYDPGDGAAFWGAIERIPGYPSGDPPMPIRTMVFEAGALFGLPAVLREVGADPGQEMLVVMDPTPMRRGPDDLKPLVLNVLREAGWQVKPLVLDPDSQGQVHTDMQQVEAVRAYLRDGMSALALGSGTVTDIVKHACHLHHEAGGHRAPFVVYKTANSVSAYTSNMSSVFLNGVKRTLPSRYADALVCDLETLCDAPREMTVAGVGDLLAFFVSIPDWYLAHRLGMDASFSEFSLALMGPLDDILLENAQAIRESKPEGMAVLAKLISLSGLAMSLSHATTPFSGFEHVMSHILDLQGELAHRPLAQHGTQVALSTIIGAETYRRVFREFDPAEVSVERCYPAQDTMHRLIMDVFASIDPSGKVGEECWSDYAVKLEQWHAHRQDFEAFLADWPEVQAQLAAFSRPPERLAELLHAVGSPLRFDQMEPPAQEDHVRFAFFTASLMRKRFSVGDLLIFLNWDRDRLWQQVWAVSQTTGAQPG